eukprot:1184834-Pyramimonas_sp.AAC.1
MVLPLGGADSGGRGARGAAVAPQGGEAAAAPLRLRLGRRALRADGGSAREAVLGGGADCRATPPGGGHARGLPLRLLPRRARQLPRRRAGAGT